MSVISSREGSNDNNNTRNVLSEKLTGRHYLCCWQGISTVTNRSVEEYVAVSRCCHRTNFRC